MQLTNDEREHALRIAALFKAAHAEHPGSRSLSALHERINRAWAELRKQLPDEQVAEIEAAAAPKTPPPNDGG